MINEKQEQARAKTLDLKDIINENQAFSRFVCRKGSLMLAKQSPFEMIILNLPRESLEMELP